MASIAVERRHDIPAPQGRPEATVIPFAPSSPLLHPRAVDALLLAAGAPPRRDP